MLQNQGTVGLEFVEDGQLRGWGEQHMQVMHSGQSDCEMVP